VLRDAPGTSTYFGVDTLQEIDRVVYEIGCHLEEQCGCQTGEGDGRLKLPFDPCGGATDRDRDDGRAQGLGAYGQDPSPRR
jgi:hypothetical protein